ncbi:MAG: hypothetical protein HYY40_08500 [Bacteroidetes bacterium]|nr:hypothetical protein [Bacteroidota bacterium]
MNDTSPYMQSVFHNLIMSKTPSERIAMCFEMMEDGYRLIESRIREERPDLTEQELKIEIFRRLYKNDFPEKEMSDIISRMKKN